MALVVPPADEERRVKVYELRNHDWFDRGTGFCTGQLIEEEPTIVVKSEDEPLKTLLSNRITKDDGYQRQQETLIVWTESTGLDMALSFQEADGCASIWEFVNQAQVQQNQMVGPDDALSDDALEFSAPVMPPIPELSNLPEIEHVIRTTSQTAQGRDQLTKFLLGEEYIRKLLPVVEMAEDLEALTDLHRLNSIMKMFILLNDTQIVEYMVSEDVVMGVLAALEYDPEFPNYKANHREYLRNKSRFKEVVPIESPEVKKKIHVTWRLQYLKDVVLARILDDPTFGVLNSLIFFNQVEIVNHLQSNPSYMKELFRVVDDSTTSPEKRKDAITFIQQCCLLAKNLQTPPRNALYANFVANGLISVLTFALGASDPGTRHAGLEILVAMIDHDAPAVRAHINIALKEKRVSLVDALVHLLHAEQDLGAKAQTADAVKVLLDPTNSGPHNPADVRQAAGPANGQGNGNVPNGNGPAGPNNAQNGNSIGAQTQAFIEGFYAHNAAMLFGPLRDLETMDVARTQLSFTESALQQYLMEILIFFVRHHHMRAKSFIGAQGLSAQIGKLLRCSSKHVALTAVKYFRTCLGLQDEFWFHEVTNNGAFGGILEVLLTESNRGRDNLLNSACLEVFDQVRREGIRPMIEHVVDNYRDKLEEGARVYGSDSFDIFGELIGRYEQIQTLVRNGGHIPGLADDQQAESSPDDDLHTHLRGSINGGRWQGLQDQDEAEEHYFNTSDDEEGDEILHTHIDTGAPLKRMSSQALVNGASSKPLVSYDDEDSDEDAGERGPHLLRTGPSESPRNPLLQSFYGTPPEVPDEEEAIDSSADSITNTQPAGNARRPSESLSEKRKREENEEEDGDAFGKLRGSSKRRSSSASAASAAAAAAAAADASAPTEVNGVADNKSDASPPAGGKSLRSKKSLGSVSSPAGEGSGDSKKGKISITFTTSKTRGDHKREEEAAAKAREKAKAGGEKDEATDKSNESETKQEQQQQDQQQVEEAAADKDKGKSAPGHDRHTRRRSIADEVS